MADIHSTFDRLAPEVLAEAGEGPGRPATAEHWFTEQAFQEATQRAQEAKP